MVSQHKLKLNVQTGVLLVCLSAPPSICLGLSVCKRCLCVSLHARGVGCGWAGRVWGGKVGGGKVGGGSEASVARLPDSPSVWRLWAQHVHSVSKHSAVKPQGSDDPAAWLFSEVGWPAMTRPVSQTKKNPLKPQPDQKNLLPRLHMHLLRSFRWLESIMGSLIRYWLAANHGHKGQSHYWETALQVWPSCSRLFYSSRLSRAVSMFLRSDHNQPAKHMFLIQQWNVPFFQSHCLKSLILNCEW